MLGLAGSVTELSQCLTPLGLTPLVLAPFAGSFLGVLVVRLPAEQSVVFGRSACAACGSRLAWYELVPLLSYAVQRGRCRHCGAPIGRFHPMIELAATAVVAWAILADGNAGRIWPGRIWIDCLLGWTLLTLAWIDWRSLLLPDVLTLPLLLAGLAVTWLLEPVAVPAHALGAACGYLGLRGVAWGYRLLRGRDGMGVGDAKLLAAAGAWLGPAMLPLLVLLSAVLGIVMAGGQAIAGRRMTATSALPFGTCLAAAFWVLWLHRDWVAVHGGLPWPG